MSTYMWNAVIAATGAVAWTIPVVLFRRAAAKSNAKRDIEQIWAETNVCGGSDSALLEVMARYPKNPIPANRWAERKIEDKDWTEALHRGAIVRAKFPKHPKAYWLSVRALSALGKQDSANALANEAIRLFPDDQDTIIELANRSEAQRDWPASRRGWKAFRQRFPQLAKGYLWEAATLAKMDNLKAAESVLQAGIDIVVGDQRKELLVPYADSAHCLQDWKEAARRWNLVRDLKHNEPMGYWKGSEALRTAGNLVEAAKILASGATMFPNNELIAVEARAIGTAEAARANSDNRLILDRL